MPYRKSYSGYRKKTYAKKASTRWQNYKQGGTQLWKDVKMLKNLINVEFKQSDVAGSVNPGTAGSLILLNGVATGDDFNSRDGRQVRIKSEQLNLRCLKNPSATNTVFRMVLFIDKQANAAAPTLTSLLDTTSTTLIDAHRNLNQRKRYVILKDVRFCVNSDTPEKIIDFYKKLDMKTVYDGALATIADIVSNSLYLGLISDEATNTPAVLYNNRIRFVDN